MYTAYLSVNYEKRSVRTKPSSRDHDTYNNQPRILYNFAK